MTRVGVLDELELVYITVACVGLFWVYDQDGADNCPVLATAEQRLHSAEGCSAPHPAPPARSPEVFLELGGDTARMADPN